MSRTFTKVGVVGLGTMGAGILEVFARSGLEVVGIDRDEASVERGKGHLTASTDRAVKRGKLTEEEQEAIFARITFSTVMEDLKDAELVVEAVPEKLELKRSIFSQLEKITPPETVLATNTSSLSVTEISVATGRPSRVVGMHFFNPAPVQKLIEVIGTVVTEPTVLDEVKDFASQLGKIAVVVSDKAGFIANALLFGYLNHAVSMFETHYASREDIDAAMRLGCGLPMGPLALLDLIGLDTAYEILDTMYKQSRDRLHAPSPIFKQMVTAGLNGRKTGRGFYTYERADSPVVVDDAHTPTPRDHASGARSVQRVGVVGSGTMATGIVEVFAKAGYDTRYVARGNEKVASVRAGLERSLDKGVLRGKLTSEERDAALARVSGTARLDDLADRDLVVEAVIEELSVKQALFATLDDILPAGAVLATTTSSLPVIEIATATRRPADVVGLHFFNPAPGHAAGRGRVDRQHLCRCRGDRARGLRGHGQARGHLRRSGRFHRQCAAVPLPQRRRQDARGALRDGRRHRHGHEGRLRLPDGPVRAARRGGPRRLAGHPDDALPGVPRAGLRPGAAARAPGHCRLQRAQGRARVPGLRPLTNRRPGQRCSRTWRIPVAKACTSATVVSHEHIQRTSTVPSMASFASHT